MWARVQNGGANLWINSKISVDIAAWNKAQRSTANLKAYIDTPEGKKTFDDIDKVEQSIRLALEEGAANKADIEARISTVINADAIDNVQKAKQQAAEAEARKSHIIVNYYDYFIKGITEGHILHGTTSKEYTEGTIRVWNDFGKYLKEYTPADMTFEEITEGFAADFRLFLKERGMMPKTISKYVICWKRLCNSAVDNDANNSLKSIRVWKQQAVSDDEKRVEIALSDDEVDAIYNMQLTGIREEVRDIWCLGYFSAQRVSDFSRLSSVNFKTADGVQFILIRQQKTGAVVRVPIVDDRVNELCLKYNYNFPKLDKRTINRYIKEICHTLSEEVPSLREMIVTRLTMAEIRQEQWYVETSKHVASGKKLHGEDRKRFKELQRYAEDHCSGEMLWKRDGDGAVLKARWECVSCHTSRRSAVTSLYNSGILDTKDLMSISGHATMKNFEQYIRRDDVSQVKRVAMALKAAKQNKIKKEA